MFGISFFLTEKENDSIQRLQREWWEEEETKTESWKNDEFPQDNGMGMQPDGIEEKNTSFWIQEHTFPCHRE